MMNNYGNGHLVECSIINYDLRYFKEVNRITIKEHKTDERYSKMHVSTKIIEYEHTNNNFANYRCLVRKTMITA